MTKKQRTIEIRCEECEKIVKALVIGDYMTETSQEEPILVSFLKCPRCAGPMIVWQDPGGAGWSEPYRMYPPEEYEIFFGFPEEIRFLLIEAYQCYKHKTYTASVIMCRKTLEGICYLNGIKRKSMSLPKRLQKLKEKGIIDNQLHEWAKVIKDAGNDAVHFSLVTFSKQDAHDILDFTRALADYIFNLREKFEKYKKRQTSRRASRGT